MKFLCIRIVLKCLYMRAKERSKIQKIQIYGNHGLSNPMTTYITDIDNK